jgi:hypothetical protein
MTNDPSIAAKANQFIKDDDGEDGPPNQATELLDAILEIRPELFQTQDGTAYISFTDEGHYKTMAIGDARLKAWLRKSAFEIFRKVITTNVITEVLAYLEAFAITNGKQMDVSVRFSQHDANIYFDLGRDDFKVVEITPAGHSVIECPRQVKFRRPRGIRPLPLPEVGGDLDELRRFINVSDEQWPLLLGWLVGAFEPHGACLILLMVGMQGSAKTTGCEVLKNLIDPGVANLRVLPSNERDLSIAGKNSFVLGYDNVSRIRPWLSDALCRVSTGAGNAVRQLYKDDDEVFFEFKRPLILNGITEFATSPDLIDRAIIIEPPYLPDSARQDMNTFLSDFEKARPRLLGALFDAVSCATSRLHQIHLKNAPRMADATRWITAAEPALPIESGAFVRAYKSNRNSAAEAALDYHKVGVAIVELMESRTEWLGNSLDLLDAVAIDCTTDLERQRAGWPKNPRTLSSQVRRIAPVLRSKGMEFEFGVSHGGRKRLIRITSNTVPTVQQSEPRLAEVRSDGTDGNAGDADRYAVLQPVLVPQDTEDDVLSIQ